MSSSISWLNFINLFYESSFFFFFPLFLYGYLMGFIFSNEFTEADVANEFLVVWRRMENFY